MIELTINGEKVSVEANTTILDAARSVGIYIPTLCAYKGLSPAGSCRICVVEVEGDRKPVASCHFPAMNGMVVKTDTPRLWELRKMMLELILATHPLDCPICDKGGECELQDITRAFEIKEPKYRLNNPKRTKAGPNPFLYIDFQKCIQCIRCARYTEEVEGIKAFDYHGSGGYSCEMDRYLERDPEAESIGGVISVCPVGALLNHPMKSHSIRPWQMTNTQTTCPHCSDGCQLILNTANNEIYRVTALSETDFSNGHPCLRGRFGFGYVNHPSRLKTPLIKVAEVQKEAGWKDALSLAAAGLIKVKERYGPDAIAFIPSSRLTNEEHRLISSLSAKLGCTVVHAYSGNNNALAGVREVLGDVYSRPLSLIDDSDFIIAVGADLTETNPFLAGRVSRAARLKESRAVVINPRKIELSRSAWRWMAPKPGTESTLLTWIGKKVSESLGGASDWLKVIDEGHLEEVTGVTSALVEKVARALVNAERPCIIVGDDISYGDNLSVGIAAANLLILSGKVDSEASGIFPVLYESNSWGTLSVYKNTRDRKALYKAITDGRVKALYVAEEDPAGDWSAGWEDALKSLELIIVQDSNITKTVETAHVVLPSFTFAETGGSYTDHEGKVRIVRTSPLSPPDLAKSGSEILELLNEKMRYHLFGSETELPSTPKTVQMSPVPIPLSLAFQANKDYPFLLLTGKRLYGSYSLFEKCKPLWDAYPEAVLEMNHRDAEKMNIRDGSIVKVSSSVGRVEARVSVKDTVLPGNLYLPIHPLNGSQKLFSPDGGPCHVMIEAIR